MQEMATEDLIVQSGAAETGQISMAFGRLEARIDRSLKIYQASNVVKISKNY